ncbi:hypothetical protein AMTRI_Chr02g266380 [Amborella trichopoda]
MAEGSRQEKDSDERTLWTWVQKNPPNRSTRRTWEHATDVIIDVNIDSQSTNSNDPATISGATLEKTPCIVPLERPRIHRLPDEIRNSNRKAFTPSSLRLGPLHREKCIPEEGQKLAALDCVLRRTGKSKEYYMEALGEHYDQIVASYEGLDPCMSGGQLLERMVIDGFFVLEMMRVEFVGGFEKLDYPSDHPVFGAIVQAFHWPHAKRDMLLLENQIPFIALEALKAAESREEPSLCVLVFWFLESIHDGSSEPDMYEGAFHLLDALHRKLTGSPGHPHHTQVTLIDLVCSAIQGGLRIINNKILGSKDFEIRIDNFWRKSNILINDRKMAKPAKKEVSLVSSRAGRMTRVGELKIKGIKVIGSDTCSLMAMDFCQGIHLGATLTLPLLVVSDIMEVLLHNLVLHELLHPSLEYKVISYVRFMRDLVRTTEDVQLLCSKKVLVNELEGEIEVVLFFKGLCHFAVKATSEDTHEVHMLRRSINNYSQPMWTKWGMWVNTYFSAFFVLTLIQTIYAILAYHSKSSL